MKGTYLVQGTGDGVAVGLANGGVVSGSEAGEEGSDGDLGEHFDLFVWFDYLAINLGVMR